MMATAIEEMLVKRPVDPAAAEEHMKRMLDEDRGCLLREQKHHREGEGMTSSRR
ncbi:hypothetical protein [Arthrobacter sp. HLT1-20]